MAELSDQMAQASLPDAPSSHAAADDQALWAKYSQIFVGSFNHSLDGKGRLVVPQSFREQLGTTFCIAPSFDFQSIALYSNIAWARMRDRYEQHGSLNSTLQRYLQWMDALTYREQECDGQGRVLLPAKIRQVILKDEKDVEITGAKDHVRVAARQASEQALTSFLENLPQTLMEIGSL